MLLRGGLRPGRSAERVQRRRGYVEVARVLQDVEWRCSSQLQYAWLGWAKFDWVRWSAHSARATAAAATAQSVQLDMHKTTATARRTRTKRTRQKEQQLN